MSDKELPVENESESVENIESLDPSDTDIVNETNTESAAETLDTAKESALDGQEAVEKAVPEVEETTSETVAVEEKTITVVDESEDPVVDVEKDAKELKDNSEETVAIIEKSTDKTSEDTAETKANAPSADSGTNVKEEIAEGKTIEVEEDANTSTTAGKASGKKEEVEADNKDQEEDVSSSDEEHEEEAEAEEEEKDYHVLDERQLIQEFQKLLKDKPVQSIKSEIDEIKTEFNAKFDDELEHKKEEFLAQGGNLIDFHYTTPLKKQFNSLYFDYKEKRNSYYQNLKRDLQANYKRREELIEELKGLLNAEENINTTYRHFKDIQDRWHLAGAIPRDKYNMIWNTYHHHVENFYDFLHLNREFRDLDFKHNLDQKLKFIGRAEELAQQSDIERAFRELQMLHKMWKEDVGPVAKEFREEVWDKFCAATKIIHERRQEFLKDQEKHFEVNFDCKTEIIDKIKEISTNTGNTHKAWQNAIKEVQKLRDAYFELGKVPRTKAKEIWNLFKESTRDFNRAKNSFYKNQKKDQYANLEKKRELIKIAEENKDGDDFEVVTPLMKKIQQDWKSIGHVPRRESDKIWKQFKQACNHYFDRVHAERNEGIKEEMEHLEAKKALLDTMSDLKFSGKAGEDIEIIKEKIKEWKAIGRVPFNKKNIERKFNKVLDELFGKLNLDKQQVEMIRFENKLSAMVSQEDSRKLQNEEFFITKRISETQGEINQLENNLGFFRHAKQDNPLVKEVRNNIARQKEQLDVWKSKLTKIRSLRKQE